MICLDTVDTPETGHLWAVILAGGEGTRVAAFTRDSMGERVPKQYSSFGSGEPMLRWALRRAAAIVPAHRTLVVVAEQHRRFWKGLLVDLPQENVIVQPANRGTAAGLLLPVLDILLRRDAAARVLVLPADHHVGSEDVLRRALLAAAHAVRMPGAPLVLLGMAADDGDNEYGFILPAARTPRDVQWVHSFVEKPEPERSRTLAAMGALVNSFIFTARGTTLVDLYKDALPELVRSFVPVVAAGSPPVRLRQLYDGIPTHDFSRAVLERCPRSLAVLPVPSCGWSDLGTPSRLEHFLQHIPLEHSPIAVAVSA
ncbi:MAG: sugar phosphate nucleotidyltransferase [Vicinamibacteria bacterium]